MKSRQIQLLVLLQLGILQQSALAADFSGANLSGAHMTNADLRGSNFGGANLTGADLSHANLTGTNVTQPQLDSACGSGTQLPAGLTIKPCLASTAAESDTRGIGSSSAYRGPAASIFEASSQGAAQ
jgi:uncharacterized protein YjbI with pentapeptide repeats